jgi:hypothetical protein
VQNAKGLNVKSSALFLVSVSEFDPPAPFGGTAANGKARLVAVDR